MVEGSVVFFDSYCVLCSRSVRFINRYDTGGVFRFSDFNSEAFRTINSMIPDPENLPDSVILYQNRKFYFRSSAALRIAVSLKFPINLLGVFFIVPPFIRDIFYDWIARNRDRWFGRRDSCFIPDPELKRKFLS